MKIRLTLSLFLLGFCLSSGAAEDTPENVARRKAEEVAQATIKGEFGKLADLTYPKVVEEMGGRDKMIGVMKTGLKEMKAKGFEFRSAKVGKTSQVVSDGDKMFAVVPFNFEIKAPGGYLAVTSFMLGISPDKGKTWTFINGDKAHDEAAKKLLPDLPAKLKLPKKEKPVFHKDE